MELRLQLATPAVAGQLVELHATANQHLTSVYGSGPWSSGPSERGVLFAMRISKVYVASNEHSLIATFRLSTKKPWAIDKTYFSASRRPVYLTSMAVHPDYQRVGVGTECLRQAERIVREWPGDAIRLDAFDAAAGAGEFYRKCQFREVGRVSYKGCPLIYFERLL